MYMLFFFFQAEDGIRDVAVTGVQTCALPIYGGTVRHGFDHHECRRDHDPCVRYLRLRPRPRGTTRGIRPGRRRAAGRDPDPHGPRTGDHAHRGKMELVAGRQGAENGARGRRVAGGTAPLIPRGSVFLPTGPSATPVRAVRSAGPSAAFTAATPGAVPARAPAPATGRGPRSRDAPSARPATGGDEAKRRRPGRSTSPRRGAWTPRRRPLLAAN